MRSQVSGFFSRRWQRLAAGLVAICAAGVLLGAQGASAGGSPVQVRFGGDIATTRIVIDADRAMEARVVGGAGDQRLVIEFPRLAVDEAAGRGQGLVSRWSLERAGTGARLSLDLSRTAQIERRFLLAPADGVEHYRYVIDLKSDAPGAAPSVADPIGALAARGQPQTAPVASRPAAPAKRTIVIDAGHGGHDPGALGAHAREKDITLAAARALKIRLEGTGRYDVVLTRTGDTFIALDERVQIARRANADLFISLHADAGANTNTRGASVYTLSDKGSTRAARSAGPNWGVDVNAGAPVVRDILFDLTQRSTRNKSAVFAEVLIQHVGQAQPLLTRAHRDNDFVVLFAPDVPAVLLEMGFMTNTADEAALRDPDHRSRLTDAIARAIDAYFASPTQTASL